MSEQNRTLTDEELMKSYQGGDASAFEKLYSRHSARVYGYLRKRLTRKEDADELLQKIFLKLHHSRNRFDSQYLFTQWLFVIARTSLLDHFRKTGRNQEHLSEVNFEKELERLSQPAAIETQDLDLLKTLPEDQQKILEWRVMDEDSYEEIAKRLGKSEASIRQIVSRAIRKLRSSLEKPTGVKDAERL